MFTKWVPAHMWQLLLFAAVLAFFHTSEFLLAAVYMPDQLSWKCEYRAAMARGGGGVDTRSGAADTLSWRDTLRRWC